jgi:hypothetical protein
VGLFDFDSPKASGGYKNLRAAAGDGTGAQIRHALEQMWVRYEPHADTDFCEAFAIDEDPCFWEMYSRSSCSMGARSFVSERN